MNFERGVNLYNRIEAARYAIRYSQKPNHEYRYFKSFGDGGGDCSNFISQCLLAGGAPMDFGGASPWWYKKSGYSNKNYDKWSLSWSVAHSLYLCLRTRNKRNLAGLQGIEVNDLDQLEIGDIIQYENAEKKVYHSAIITNFIFNGRFKEPLVSQHSYDALNTSYLKPRAVKMHFIKIYVKSVN
jgi:hypothetical protein